MLSKYTHFPYTLTLSQYERWFIETKMLLIWIIGVWCVINSCNILLSRISKNDKQKSVVFEINAIIYTLYI